MMYIKIKNTEFYIGSLSDYTQSVGLFLSDNVSQKLITNEKSSEESFTALYRCIHRKLHGRFNGFILDEWSYFLISYKLLYCLM